ncbi:MAG: T9SS type A sorting domain-containing protein [Bacteroidia bacterium]|jgi:hypothetical protein
MRAGLLLFIISVLVCNSSICQVNTYFENNPVWQDGTSCAVPYPCIKNETLIYKVQGDTLINAVLYKKILKKSQGYYYYINGPDTGCSGSFSTVDSIPSYFLRSEDKKMFVLLPGDTSEHLLYDFNLVVGDTLPLSYTTFTNDIIVSAIDSVYTAYGYLKRFALTGNGAASYLIEGIGSSHGLFAPISVMLECGYTQNCFSLNDTAYYPQAGPTCDLNVGMLQLKRLTNYRFAPNPLSVGTVLMSDIYLQNATLIIYNSFGMVVKQVNGLSGVAVSIDTKELSTGLYFTCLIQSNTLLHKEKLIIKK